MTIIPHVSQTMQTLLTTTETIAAALAYVKRPDRAKFCNGQPPFAHCTWFKKRTAGTAQRLFSAFLMHRNDEVTVQHLFDHYRSGQIHAQYLGANPGLWLARPAGGQC